MRPLKVYLLFLICYCALKKLLCITMSNITVNQVFCPVDDAKVETKKSQCNHESRTVNKCGNNGINVGILVGIIPTSHQIQEAFSYIIASFSLIAISIIKRPIRKFPSCLIIVFCDI